MFTPLYDVPQQDLVEAGSRLSRAAERTSRVLKTERKWDGDGGLSAVGLLE